MGGGGGIGDSLGDVYLHVRCEICCRQARDFLVQSLNGDRFSSTLHGDTFGNETN